MCTYLAVVDVYCRPHELGVTVMSESGVVTSEDGEAEDGALRALCDDQTIIESELESTPPVGLDEYCR